MRMKMTTSANVDGSRFFTMYMPGRGNPKRAVQFLCVAIQNDLLNANCMLDFG